MPLYPHSILRRDTRLHLHHPPTPSTLRPPSLQFHAVLLAASAAFSFCRRMSEVHNKGAEYLSAPGTRPDRAGAVAGGSPTTRKKGAGRHARWRNGYWRGTGCAAYRMCSASSCNYSTTKTRDPSCNLPTLHLRSERLVEAARGAAGRGAHAPGLDLRRSHCCFSAAALRPDAGCLTCAQQRRGAQMRARRRSSGLRRLQVKARACACAALSAAGLLNARLHLRAGSDALQRNGLAVPAGRGHARPECDRVGAAGGALDGRADICAVYAVRRTSRGFS